MMDFGKKKSAAQIAAEKESDDLTKAYKAWRREQKSALLSGKHGREARDLLNWAARLDLADAGELIARIRSAEWIEHLESSERYVLLRLINTAIVNLRERNGLPPFDDGLPDEPPKAYHQIKSILGCR